MAIDSGILLKNDVNCNFILKYYITIYENFKSTFGRI